MKQLILSTILCCLLSPAFCQQEKGNLQKGDYGYLYCHMNDLGRAWTAYALSRDGFHYHDLLGGDSIFSDAEVARIEGATRDAYICRQHDGKGYLMVCTDMNVGAKERLGKVATWDNYGIDLLRSDDLIHWESVTFDFRQGPAIFSNPEAESVYRDWTTINRVWAPQIMWDGDYLWPDGHQGGYFIYYSMWNRGEEAYDRMYYSYADADFKTLTQPRLLFDWGYATIDADINWLPTDGLWHMMIKKEGGQPGLFTATAPELTGPWGEPVEDDYVSFEGNKKCEGVSAFQLAGDSTWVIGYIEYSSNPKNYRLCRADQYMRNFRNPKNIEGVARPQHGSFLRLTKEEYERLEAWGRNTQRKEDWKLVWSDEFNGDGAPDSTVWNFEEGFKRNHEDQWYQSANAWQENGCLVIEGRQEHRPNPNYDPQSQDWRKNREFIDYTSACITTAGKKDFRYGRLEVCAKIPTASGAWPAIWTLGNGIEWPSNGEIDIMEYYRINGAPHILANAAWGNDERFSAVWNSQKIPFSHFTEGDKGWADRFHVWRMDWDETSIRIYLDDELLNDIPLSTTINGSIGHGENPFTKPQYILLNLALGGDNGGTIDNAAFPLRYEIDYVRIYQK